MQYFSSFLTIILKSISLVNNMEEQVTPPQPTTPPVEPVVTTPVVQPHPASSKWPIVLVVLVLAVLGLGGAGAFYLVSRNSTAVPTPTSMPLATEVVPTTGLTLTLNSPVDNTLAMEPKIMVSGKTSPNTLVVILTESDQNTVESDTMGNFQSEIGLESGINTLTVIAYGENGEEKELSYNIVYDDQK
jgi:hypothetical protein